MSMTTGRSTDISQQVEDYMLGLDPFPAQPMRAILDAMDVLEDVGPALGRPLVDVINLEPDYPDAAAVFGKHLKELRPLGTSVRVLFTFAPDRTLVLLHAGDKSGVGTAWYREAIGAAAREYRDYLDWMKEEGLL